MKHVLPAMLGLIGLAAPALAADTLAALPLPRAVKLLEAPELHRAGDLVAVLPPARAAALLGLMADDRATDIVHELDAAERARLTKALEVAAKDRDGLAARLSNPNFTDRAKPEAVEKAREDHAARAAEADRLTEALARLG